MITPGGGDGAEARAKLAARSQGSEREERVRLAELRQKHALEIHLRLLSLLVVQQPKLLVHGRLTQADGLSGALELVWDPLSEAVEPTPCPNCQRPTLALGLTRRAPVLYGSHRARRKHPTQVIQESVC